MKKKLTIKEIAELSGVGKSTVSRFFNEGYVSDSSKEKIEKVIAEFGYTPNLFARGIKAKNNSFIGIVVPCLDSSTISTILMNLDSSLREAGYVPLIISTNHNIELELESLKNLYRLNVEGIILLATEVTPQHEEFVKNSKIPILFVGQVSKYTYSIVNDEESAGKTLGKYIVSKGHKKILYVGVSEKDISVGCIRKNAVLSNFKNIDFDYIESDFSFETTEKLIYEYFNKNKATCIICATDNMAFGAIRALHKLNINIPLEVSIASFGGYKVSELITPPLCTIKFNNIQTGKLAAKSILKLLKNESIEKLQKISFEFLKRDSVTNL